MGNGTFAAQVGAAVMVMLYWAAMFAGGAVGAVGLVLPPPHATIDPIPVMTASHFFIVPPKQLSIRIG
jgi:hypothetical protein